MKITRANHRIKLWLFFLLLVQSAAAQDNQQFSINESPLPAPTGFINDYVGVIDAATRQRLEQRLTAFKNANNPPIELAVAIVKTTGDRPIFDYSLAVARGWGIGAKQDDNPSALLLIATEDRKYYTQVSRDLEDELPDALVGQLQRQNLVPSLRQSNYNKAVEDTLEAYIRTIEQRTSGTTVPVGNTETNQQQPRSTTVGRSSLSTLGCCLIGLIVLLILIFSRSGRKSRRDHDRWGGGGGFGGGGGALPWIIGSIIANSGSSSGGWSSGGSSDWGGGDSGGWGGFGGGGDFGGGGAGGDW